MKIRASFALLVPAFLAAFIGLIPLFDSTATFSPTLVSVLGVACLTIAVFLPREWARDRYAAALFLLVVLSVPLFVAGATVAFFDGPGRMKGIAVVVVFGVVLVLLARVVWQERHFEDRLPHWLLTKFPRQVIFEDDGIQWTVERSGMDVAQGASVRIYLQNNIDAERAVTLRFRDESGFWLRTGQVAFPAMEPVSLPSRGHAIVTVPILRATDRTLDSVRVYTMVEATGPSGPRNRRWRAPAGPRPLPRWLVVVGPFAGMFIWQRGGVFVTVSSSGSALSTAPPPLVNITLVS